MFKFGVFFFIILPNLSILELILFATTDLFSFSYYYVINLNCSALFFLLILLKTFDIEL